MAIPIQMIPERGTKQQRKRAVLECCSLRPRDGETFFIPIKRRFSADTLPWVVDGGNDETVCLRRPILHQPEPFGQYTSFPLWRWEEMLRGNHLQFLGFEDDLYKAGKLK